MCAVCICSVCVCVWGWMGVAHCHVYARWFCAAEHGRQQGRAWLAFKITEQNKKITEQDKPTRSIFM